MMQIRKTRNIDPMKSTSKNDKPVKIINSNTDFVSSLITRIFNE